MTPDQWIQLTGIVASFAGVVVTAVLGLLVAKRKSAHERPEAADQATRLQAELSQMDRAQNEAIAQILAHLHHPPSKSEAEQAIAQIRALTQGLPHTTPEGDRNA